MKLVKNTKYYGDVVYEFNLPVGHTCPYELSFIKASAVIERMKVIRR